MRGKSRWVAHLVATVIVVSCGARTGLREPSRDAGLDAPAVDAGEEQEADVAEDVAPDTPPDVEPDVPPDVPADVPIDGLAPCDPEDLFVYLVTSETQLYRYDPGTGELKLVGTLKCPAINGSPFSMGVSRTGTAYVVYRPVGAPGANPPGKLFAVDISNANCATTDFVPGQHGFNLFGMGFAIDDNGQGETLYVAASGNPGVPSLGLASIDLASYELTPIAPFSQNPGYRIELTSSDDGQLYGYFLDPNGNGGYVVRIDKATAQILDLVPVAAGNNDAFAFAYWGGDFYVFTSPLGGPTTITRYRPQDGSIVKVGSIPQTVVGAGVSTCSVK